MLKTLIKVNRALTRIQREQEREAKRRNAQIIRERKHLEKERKKRLAEIERDRKNAERILNQKIKRQEQQRKAKNKRKYERFLAKGNKSLEKRCLQRAKLKEQFFCAGSNV
ncbi:hypothetical protein [Phocoenobacter skyensis]|uniref:Cohesin loading factor subunit SCC2/myosin X n=1 Tax=Phocoenobacter skyensis TaxID=97481 RepID=A0A1H7ZZW5_9PAST|nr:hypothetical protein [Pasteurella skyensis]MDP8184420.1 hypothetical protein [Pasteurella skyensis]QLB22580.1 hypothetical protein A6B44_04920 [Pasteurella skyensis]SEM63776.1 cohesin loading factor subunit SCC2/myosin X [Pasteurella skyensis]